MGDLLKVGDVIELTSDHVVSADIPAHFVYGNRRGDWSLVRASVKLYGNFDYLRGRYVVTGTCSDGGGTAHGPSDTYPDGHHVFCERVKDGVKVDFYQTGCFMAMNTDIKPCGKAVMRGWVEVAD